MTVRLLLVSLFTMVTLTGCKSMNQSAAEPGVITGNVVYRQRIALPPDAVVRVVLEDVSKADAPAEVIAETTIPTEGRQVPIAYRLTYSPAQIDSTHRYQLRATIHSSEQLLFTTTTAHAAFTGGASTDLLVHQASEPTAPDAELVNTYWKLLEVNGHEALTMNNIPETHIVLQIEESRLTGMGGVNRLIGHYEIDGNKLQFNQAGSTMMAGPEPLMKQEQEFMEALRNTAGYRITGQQMELLDRAGKTLAKFEAVYLR